MLHVFEKELFRFQNFVFDHKTLLTDAEYLELMGRARFWAKLVRHPNADDIGVTSPALRAAHRSHLRRLREADASLRCNVTTIAARAHAPGP